MNPNTEYAPALRGLVPDKQKPSKITALPQRPGRCTRLIIEDQVKLQNEADIGGNRIIYSAESRSNL
jgi:hypothetical protein